MNHFPQLITVNSYNYFILIIWVLTLLYFILSCLYVLGQKGDDELTIQIMYLLYQLMCHPITGDYIIQNTGTIFIKV